MESGLHEARGLRNVIHLKIGSEQTQIAVKRLQESLFGQLLSLSVIQGGQSLVLKSA